jgi:hypothetical protein
MLPSGFIRDLQRVERLYDALNPQPNAPAQLGGPLELAEVAPGVYALPKAPRRRKRASEHALELQALQRRFSETLRKGLR